MGEDLHLQGLIDSMGKMEDERNPFKFMRLWLILVVGALIAIGEGLLALNDNFVEANLPAANPENGDKK